MAITNLSKSLPCLMQSGIHEYIQHSPQGRLDDFSVLYIDIIAFSQMEQNLGSVACDFVLSCIYDLLSANPERTMLPFPNADALHIWDDGFVVIIPERVNPQIHGSIVHRFVSALEELLNKKITAQGLPSARLRYGIAVSEIMVGLNLAQQERNIYNLITSAGRIARRHLSPPPLHLLEELENIILNQDIRALYQPIIHLKTSTVMGWECLSRGPTGSDLESPLKLLDCAERAGSLVQVEQICRTKAIEHARYDENRMLFVNVSPNIFSDPSFKEGQTRMILDGYGWRPEQIVFEITEHHAIKEYSSFLQIIAHYRKQGYKIAIDDVGAGYSGLVTLMQVKPDFVKIDMELVRGIEKDQTRQDIVLAICQISKGFGAKTIAEGIETIEELSCMQNCQVDYGQGFFLGRPQEFPIHPEIS